MPPKPDTTGNPAWGPPDKLILAPTPENPDVVASNAVSPAEKKISEAIGKAAPMVHDYKQAVDNYGVKTVQNYIAAQAGLPLPFPNEGLDGAPGANTLGNRSCSSVSLRSLGYGLECHERFFFLATPP